MTDYTTPAGSSTTLPVASGETRSLRLDGRRAGRYPISFGPAGDALLVTGAEVGP